MIIGQSTALRSISDLLRLVEKASKAIVQEVLGRGGHHRGILIRIEIKRHWLLLGLRLEETAVKSSATTEGHIRRALPLRFRTNSLRFSLEELLALNLYFFAHLSDLIFKSADIVLLLVQDLTHHIVTSIGAGNIAWHRLVKSDFSRGH